MLNASNEHPFEQLPQSLVQEMLDQCPKLSESLSSSFKKLSDQKNQIRKALTDKKYLGRDADYLGAPTYPTTCAVDGSYSIERLLFTDLVAFAAVAVEGLTPPTNERPWTEPKHKSRVIPVPHSDATSVVARATMMCMELILATNAPHDVVFFDGSLTTPFIYINQGLARKNEVSKELGGLLDEHLERALESYKEILLAQKSDKIYAGLPKYTSKKEISSDILGYSEYEDRGLLSFVLQAGEYSGPVNIKEPETPWHIQQPDNVSESLIDEIKQALYDLSVIYYRPYEYFPALRIEIAKAIRSNKNRIAVLMEAINMQCAAPGILEPYPLYLADRMVKHLGTALPAIRKTATQEMSLKWEDTLGNMFLAMSSYRTEWGK